MTDELTQHDTTALNIMAPVGEPAQAQIEGRKYTTVLRGVAAPKWIFLDIPKHQGKLVSLAKQQAIKIRYLYNGIVYGFQTKISGVYISPYQILVVKFPKKFERLNLRRNERIKTIIPITVNTPDNRTLEEAAIVNISRDGALLSVNMDAAPEIGSRLKISLKLLDGRKIEDLECVVIHCKNPEGAYLIGVEYEPDGGEQLGWLKGFYDECVSPFL